MRGASTGCRRRIGVLRRLSFGASVIYVELPPSCEAVLEETSYLYEVLVS